MGFGDAVASAGPYANNLHLAADRQPHQHLNTQFLQVGCSSWRPTDSVKALKARHLLCNIIIINFHQSVPNSIVWDWLTTSHDSQSIYSSSYLPIVFNPSRESAPRSRQITTPAPHHSVCNRPGALPAAQPTTSKHWRQWTGKNVVN